MSLECKTIQSFTVVDHKELDRFIKEFFGVDYNFVEREDPEEKETSFLIQPKFLTEVNMLDIKFFKQGKLLHIHAILTFLCSCGEIEAGKYLIKIQ